MCTRSAFVAGSAAVLAAPVAASARTGDPKELEIAFPRMRRIADRLWLGRLSRHVWVHTTTHDLGHGDDYPANGAIVVHGSSATLVDTGWSDTDANAIVDAWAALRMPPIATAIATHFHTDRVGGIDALAKRGIPTFGNPLTIGLALDNGHPAPRPLHDVEKHPHTVGGIEVFYPGAGHTIDNVVAWIPSDAVLFGGCLVKATTAPDLGNLGDAVIGAYPQTVRNVMRRYAAARHVIPGHGTIAGDALGHTLAMAHAALPAHA